MSTAEPLFEISQFPRNQGEFDFLSPERQQKYDLLLHLLANLGQPLFLSGPDGIGKSTFLAHLRDHPPPGWRICLFEASPETDLEQVRRALAESQGAKAAPEKIRRDRQDDKSAGSGFGTQSGPRRGEPQGWDEQMVVLALDDAGSMIPGALDAVCRLVAKSPELRLVAALRPDELHLKAVTDPWAVGEAQVIELPPLTEQQCAEYFERLWVQRGRSGEPDPERVQEIYRRTHGVPARIQQEGLELFGRPPLRWHLALAKPVYLALGVVGVAVVAVTYYWQAAGQKGQTESPSQPIALTQSAPEVQSLPPSVGGQSAEVTAPKQGVAEVIPAAPPLSDPALQRAQTSPVSSASSEENRGEETGRLAEQVPVSGQNMASQVVAVEEPPKFEPPDREEPKTVPPELTESAQKPEVEPPVPKAPPKPEAAPPTAETQPPAAENPKPQDAALEVAKAAGIQPREWVLKRPPDHFALQIGFFQNPKALAAFARRHPGLRPLSYYPKGKGYVLLYGAFRSIDEVQQATRKLPPEVGQASIWRFKSVQDAVHTLPASP